MLNIGPQELVLILVVALVIVGPKKLPELARAIGRGMNEFRKIQDEVKDLVTFDLGIDLDDLTADQTTSSAEPTPATDEPNGDRAGHYSADLGSPPDPEPLPSVKAAEREPDPSVGTDDEPSSAAG
jgi:Tat protein translocase TatB subunit